MSTLHASTVAALRPPIDQRCKAMRARIAVCLVVLLLPLALPAVEPLPSAFSYQGQLQLDGELPTGSFDFQFQLFDSATGGNAIGAAINRPATPVEAGEVQLSLDVEAGQFAGDRQWLEVRVRPSGQGPLTPLSPRSEVLAVPQASSAAALLNDSVVAASIAAGGVGSADIDSASVQRRVSGVCAAPSAIGQINQDGSVLCADLQPNPGTVSLVETGTGLSGGPITGEGTIAVADGGVGATQINIGQVQRRITTACAPGSLMQSVGATGSASCASDNLGPPRWQLTGNDSIDPDNQFIGTVNGSEPLVLRVRNTPALALYPSLNLVNGVPNTSTIVAGSHANSATRTARGVTIGGGGVPPGYNDPGLVIGGPNLGFSNYVTVSGGANNQAGDPSSEPIGAFATISGGRFNVASRQNSTILGGEGNVASQTDATVGGGVGNTASFIASTVLGGTRNAAVSLGSTVAGGADNCAAGLDSWVGGRQGVIMPTSDPGSGPCSVGGIYPTLLPNNSFLWSGGVFGTTPTVVRSNSFSVVAASGAVFTTNSLINGAGLGVTLRITGLMRFDTLGGAGIVPVCINADSNVSLCSSSRRYKQDIQSLSAHPDHPAQDGLTDAADTASDGSASPDAQTLLDLLRPVAFRWRDNGIEDIGLIAEEVAAIDTRLIEYNAAGEIEGVRYSRLNAILVDAAQDLLRRQEQLHEELRRAEQRRAAMRETLEDLLRKADAVSGSRGQGSGAHGASGLMAVQSRDLSSVQPPRLAPHSSASAQP